MDVARSRLVIVKIVTPALTGLALLAGPIVKQCTGK